MRIIQNVGIIYNAPDHKLKILRCDLYGCLLELRAVCSLCHLLYQWQQTRIRENKSKKREERKEEGGERREETTLEDLQQQIKRRCRNSGRKVICGLSCRVSWKKISTLVNMSRDLVTTLL